MGKIQEAIHRSKSAPLSSAAEKRRARAAAMTNAANETDEMRAIDVPLLAQHATLLPLDPAALEANRVVVGSQPGGPASSYKMLRTRMLHRLAANRWRSVAVTSTRTGAGKSLTAVNTAISLAQEHNQQVILVDLDLRRPSIADVLDIEHKFGIVDYLEGKVPIEKVVARTSIDRLLILPNHVGVEPGEVDVDRNAQPRESEGRCGVGEPPRRGDRRRDPAQTGLPTSEARREPGFSSRIWQTPLARSRKPASQ